MESALLAMAAVISSFTITLVIDWAILKAILKIMTWKS